MEFMSEERKMWYVKKIHQMPFENIYHSPKGHDIILEHTGYTPLDVPHRTH